MDKLILKIEAIAGAVIMRLLRTSLRYTVQGQPPNDHPCIYVFWHRNILIMAMQRIDDNIAVMVSSSRDGEMISGPIKYMGYVPVRGSTSREGSKALKEMIRLSRTHSLAITPDGPKGPEGTIQPGLYQIALLAKVPIIPIAVSTNQEWVLNSWDRFRIPRPFARISVVYGKEIPVNSRDDFTTAELILREGLADLSNLKN